MRTDATSSAAAARLCVLASGSSGNCAVLRLDSPEGPWTGLLDLGLSPRRLALELQRVGACLDEVDDVVLTHVDSDHFQRSWLRRLPERVRLWVAPAHRQALRELGRPCCAVETSPLEQACPVAPGVQVQAQMGPHDEDGVAVLRFDTSGGSLGWATDLGRPLRRLAQFLHGVDALGVESNHCPVLQRASARPSWLKARIMGGAGHLSNAQSAAFAAAVAPRRRLVLLHLSRDCNSPRRALEAHKALASRVEIAVASAHRATGWLPVGGERPAVQTLGPGGLQRDLAYPDAGPRRA